MSDFFCHIFLSTIQIKIDKFLPIYKKWIQNPLNSSNFITDYSDLSLVRSFNIFVYWSVGRCSALSSFPRPIWEPWAPGSLLLMSFLPILMVSNFSLKIQWYVHSINIKSTTSKPCWDCLIPNQSRADLNKSKVNSAVMYVGERKWSLNHLKWPWIPTRYL